MELLLDEDCPKFDNFWLKNQEYGWLIIAGTDFFTKLTVTPKRRASNPKALKRQSNIVRWTV